MQTYTDVGPEGHLRSREARLLQPDNVAAISAFGEIRRTRNARTTPCTVAVKRCGVGWGSSR